MHIKFVKYYKLSTYIISPTSFGERSPFQGDGNTHDYALYINFHLTLYFYKFVFSVSLKMGNIRRNMWQGLCI